MQKQFSISFSERNFVIEFYIRTNVSEKFISYVGVIQHRTNSGKVYDSYEKSFGNGIDCEAWLLTEGEKLERKYEN